MAASPYKKKKARGKTVSLHRLVWEQANGPIPDGYIVHHIDEDKMNNVLSNLQLVTHAEHSKIHLTKYPTVKICEVCEAEYEPHPTKRKRSKTCSKDCARELMSRAARTRAPKHSDETIATVLARVAAGEKQKAVAVDLGIPITTVNCWVKGRSRALVSS